MTNSLRNAWQFVRTHPPRVVWKAFFRPENQHPLIQFSKYVLFGVLSVVVYNAVFGLLGWTQIFPHFVAQGLPTSQRVWFFTAASFGGFLAANLVAYLSNSKYVFQRGRHRGLKEFLVFTAMASIGFLAGLGLSLREVIAGTRGSWDASMILIVSSTVVNFVTRKFWVFKG